MNDDKKSLPSELFTSKVTEFSEEQETEWIIDSLFSLKKTIFPVGKCLLSPGFLSSIVPESQFYFRLFPFGCKEIHRDRFCLYICLRSKRNVRLTINCIFQVRNSDRHVVANYVHTGTVTDTTGTGFFDCRDKFSRSNFFVDGVVTIACRFNSKFIPSEGIKFRQKSILYDDLQRLRNEEKFCDVEIVCNERIFHVHKLVLQARSPVFAAMFTSFLEGKTNKVIVEDINPEVMEHLLEYMYTDKVSPKKYPFLLLIAADKYALDGLKQLCEHYLISKITGENAVDILKLAEKFNCQNLKEKAIRFISKIPPKELVDENDYWNLVDTHPSLLREILSNALAPKNN